MISTALLISTVSGLTLDDLELWVGNNWVKAHGNPGSYSFEEIDVARVRLIVDLRDDLEVNLEAMPVVLSLIDQLYDLRRQLRLGRHAAVLSSFRP